MIACCTTYLLMALLLPIAIPVTKAFTFSAIKRTRGDAQSRNLKYRHLRPTCRLLAVSDEDSSSSISQETADASTLGALPPSSNDSATESPDITSTALPTGASASMAMMMSQENKRILIEDLGYRRADVERLKFELVPVLVEKRMRCPEEGVPVSWCRSEAELEAEKKAIMMQRLEQESKFPLKLPLIGISLVLFGKGFSDALITIIKVNMDFPGASLADEFLGIPVLLIDVVCILAGAGMGWWTWTNMK